MKLSIVIVSYNVKFYLEQCLLSLQRALTDIEAEVFVVDNHSRDDSVAFLRERFPWVNYIECNHNWGFSRANNMAIRQSRGEYVLLLNPDTIVGETTIRRCLDFMDAHPDAGAAGVRMLQGNGSDAKESRRGLPSPMVAFYKMAGLCSRYPQSRRFGHYYMGYLPWDEPAQIEVVSGAYCLLRRKVLDKVGLLDEDYFMYGEDIDLSYRILKGGYHNYYLPEKILHYKGESTHKSSFRYVHVFYDAMLIFLRKHYGHVSFLLALPIKAAVYMKAALALVSMGFSRMRRSLGFADNAHRSPTHYLFIGSESTIAHLRQQARERGLSATFLVADSRSCPDGHLSHADLLGKQRPVAVVYDTDAYSYEQILDIFSSQPEDEVLIGTYSNASQRIITGEETI